MKRYEEIPHTADLAARVYGKDIPELFANAAHAMFELMGHCGEAGGKVEVKVEVEAPDKESLLISFLNEILYISYIKKAVFAKFKFQDLSTNGLKASVSGHLKSGERQKHEIKAATYHDVKITKTADGYETTVVFDI